MDSGNGKPRKPLVRSPHRLRAKSRESKFSRIKKLKCFLEVQSMILDGFPMSEVARLVQDDHKESTDITRGSLITILNDYRSAIPKADLIAKRMPKVMLDAKKEVEGGLDELAEMQKLFELQMARVSIDATTEKKIRKLMPSMTQEIRTAREILANYADLKMDLGLTTRHQGTLQVDGRFVAEMGDRYGQAVEKVMADPESRRKVLGAAKRLLALGAKEGSVIDVESTPVEVELDEAEGTEVAEDVAEDVLEAAGGVE